MLAALYCTATRAELDAAHFSTAAVTTDSRDLLTAGMFSKTAEASASPEGRGLLDTRRELSTLAATDCSVRGLNDLAASCGSDTPVPACCTGQGSSDTCSTNNNGAGGQCGVGATLSLLGLLPCLTLYNVVARLTAAFQSLFYTILCFLANHHAFVFFSSISKGYMPDNLLTTATRFCRY